MIVGPLREAEEELEELDRVSEGGPYRALATVPKYEDSNPSPFEPEPVKRPELEDPSAEYVLVHRIIRLETELRELRYLHKRSVQVVYVLLVALFALMTHVSFLRR